MSDEANPAYSKKVRLVALYDLRAIDRRERNKEYAVDLNCRFAGITIGILVAWLRHVSRRARLERTFLAEARLTHTHESKLGAYEKARVERYLNEVDAGRMTFGQAQHAIAIAWIATYHPMRHSKVRIGRLR